MNTPFLEYELLSPETVDPIIMRITGQRERGFEGFQASNGHRIRSIGGPAYYGDGWLYVRGKQESRDIDKITIPLADWPAVKQAIRELNEAKEYEEYVRSLKKIAQINKEKDMSNGTNDEGFRGFTRGKEHDIYNRWVETSPKKEQRFEFDLNEWEYGTSLYRPDGTPENIILTRKKPRVKVEWRRQDILFFPDYGTFYAVQFRVTGHMDKAHLQYDTGRGIMFFVRPRYNTTRYNTYESMTDDVTIAQDAFSKWSAPVLLPESVYSRLNEITKALEEKANGGKG